MEAIGGLFVLGLIMMGGFLALAATVFWIWMLVAAIQNRGLSDGEKVGWVLAIVFLHFIGALLYFFIGHPKRNVVTAASNLSPQPAR